MARWHDGGRVWWRGDTGASDKKWRMARVPTLIYHIPYLFWWTIFHIHCSIIYYPSNNKYLSPYVTLSWKTLILLAFSWWRMGFFDASRCVTNRHSGSRLACIYELDLSRLYDEQWRMVSAVFCMRHLMRHLYKTHIRPGVLLHIQHTLRYAFRLVYTSYHFATRNELYCNPVSNHNNLIFVLVLVAWRPRSTRPLPW